jgi:hypothetical protein
VLRLPAALFERIGRLLMTIYIHHRITCAPRRWLGVAERLACPGSPLAAAGGTVYGLWRSQIGRSRDEVTAITCWAQPVTPETAEVIFVNGDAEVAAICSRVMEPTLRPVGPEAPVRQGNYAFRWFITPEDAWGEFLDLCAQAWPGFEAAYDSQVIGLWRCTSEETGDSRLGLVPTVSPGCIASLLLTRRPDLAMWERSKLPQGAAETVVRDALSRRYDLCDWTGVVTTTLLTATDSTDRARWA